MPGNVAGSAGGINYKRSFVTYTPGIRSGMRLKQTFVLYFQKKDYNTSEALRPPLEYPLICPYFYIRGLLNF
jgi:hypothetical protein